MAIRAHLTFVLGSLVLVGACTGDGRSNGSSCTQDAQCLSDNCVDQICVDHTPGPELVPEPEPEPSPATTTIDHPSGGGVVISGEKYRARITVGPTIIGPAESESYRAKIGVSPAKLP